MVHHNHYVVIVLLQSFRRNRYAVNMNNATGNT